MKKIMMLIIAILLLVVTNDVFSQTKNKTGATLQHPYDTFVYNVVPVDSCCYDIFISQPANGTNGHHTFKVEVNNKTYINYDYGFTYPNYGSINSVSFMVCGDDNIYHSFKNISIKIICSECGTADQKDTLLQFKCTPDECCTKYFLDPNIDSNMLIRYGYPENYMANAIRYKNCCVDPISGLKYLLFCPKEDDKEEIPIKIEIPEPFGTITDTIETNCCNCKTERYSPFTVVKLDPEEMNCPDSTYCAYKLDFGSRLGLPTWTECYDSINISLESHLHTGLIYKNETYQLTSFAPEDFGVICIPPNEERVFKIEFIKDGYIHNGEDLSMIGCNQIFGFDCNGIIYDTSYTRIIPKSEPCTPDCDSIPWICDSPRSLTVQLQNGATAYITYNYVYREGCNFQDIQVTEYSTTIIPAFIREDLYDSFIFAKIIEDIIKKNRMNFYPFIFNDDPIGITKCDTTWRVTMGSCWATIPYTYGGPYPDVKGLVTLPPSYTFDTLTSTGKLMSAHFNENSTLRNHLTWYKQKCADVDCCTQKMVVCKTKIAQKREFTQTVYDWGAPFNQYNCDNIYAYYTDWAGGQSYIKKCNPTCNFLTELIPFIFEPGSSKITFLTDFSEILNYSIHDYFANEQINISYSLNGTANVQVIVFTVNGQYIDEQIISSDKGNHNIKINTNDYNTGVYFYTIIINNKMIKSNKFVIVK